MEQSGHTLASLLPSFSVAHEV